MAENRQDPLVESLMALAVSAAPLIRRARESGMFKASRAEEAAESVVDVEVVTPAAEKPDFAAEKAALQDIVVNQAMKIAQLEAEVARLMAAAAKPRKADKRGLA